MSGFPGRAPGSRAARRPMIPSAGREGATVIQLGELVMILDLHRQGLSVSAIARRVGIGENELVSVASEAAKMRMEILERLERGRAGQILCNRRKTGQRIPAHGGNRPKSRLARFLLRKRCHVSL